MANGNGKDGGNPFEAFSGNGKGLKQISDVLTQYFIGKYLELYIGDQVETLEFTDHSVPENCVIYGKLIEVLDRFLVFDCFYVDKKDNNVKSGNIVFINFFQIRAMSELNGVGSLGDVFLSVNDAKRIQKIIGVIK